MASLEERNEIDFKICEGLDRLYFDYSDIKWKTTHIHSSIGTKGLYNPSTKTILVEESLDEEEMLETVAHEFVHAMRLESDRDILMSDDFEDLVNTTDDYELKKILQKLVSMFTILSRVWTSDEAVNNTVDEIDNILEELSDLKDVDEDNENASTWKWLSKNYEKIYESIDYYSVGGHDSKWYSWKDRFEKCLGFEIPVAE